MRQLNVDKTEFVTMKAKRETFENIPEYLDSLYNVYAQEETEKVVFPSATKVSVRRREERRTKSASRTSRAKNSSTPKFGNKQKPKPRHQSKSPIKNPTPKNRTPESGTFESGTPKNKTPKNKVPKSRTPAPEASRSRNKSPIKVNTEKVGVAISPEKIHSYNMRQRCRRVSYHEDS